MTIDFSGERTNSVVVKEDGEDIEAVGWEVTEQGLQTYDDVLEVFEVVLTKMTDILGNFTVKRPIKLVFNG